MKLMGKVPKLLGQVRKASELIKPLYYLTSGEKEVEYVDGEGTQSGSHPAKTQPRTARYVGKGK